ncbi:MAG: hypothetical protein HC819_15065 [Cyclobacteriaceae bacterium]|nr:hypothetical protein [Cyclobacteriaceae bacterium]
MITKEYNPSPIEVRFVEALCALQAELSSKLKHYTVVKIEKNTVLDNPIVDILLQDQDGDEHEIILKVIQKPDQMV